MRLKTPPHQTVGLPGPAPARLIGAPAWGSLRERGDGFHRGEPRYEPISQTGGSTGACSSVLQDMANVLLISCNLAREPYPVYPLGMTLVAEAARAKGHRVVQRDLLCATAAPEQVVDAAHACDFLWTRLSEVSDLQVDPTQDDRSFEPDVIGLSLRNIDNCDSAGLVSYTDFASPAPSRSRLGLGSRPEFGAVTAEQTVGRPSPTRGGATAGPADSNVSPTELVRALRMRTDSPIVLGGAGYSLFPELLLDRIGADYGIVGEGEVAFCDLVEKLARNEHPGQRIVFGNGVIPGEQFSCDRRDPELAAFYLREGGMLNVQTKRGCPLRCAYCTYPVLEGRSYRFRPAESVVDEIETLVTRYNTNYYAMADSVFNDREGRYLAVAEELVRRGIDVPWMAFFRPQLFGPEEIALLKRAGLHSVEWGTDCASDATLEGMRKGFTWHEVEHSNRLFAEAGIYNAHFLIFCGPGETEQTLAQGLANIERLTDCVVFAYCGVRILPGTAVHDQAVAQGIVTAADNLLEARFYCSPQITRERAHQALTQSFAGRQDRIYPPGKDSERIRAFHRMGHRGPIWDLLLRGGTRRRRRSVGPRSGGETRAL